MQHRTNLDSRQASRSAVVSGGHCCTPCGPSEHQPQQGATDSGTSSCAVIIATDTDTAGAAATTERTADFLDGSRVVSYNGSQLVVEVGLPLLRWHLSPKQGT